jgi:5'-3' exonuclease
MNGHRLFCCVLVPRHEESIGKIDASLRNCSGVTHTFLSIVSRAVTCENRGVTNADTFRVHLIDGTYELFRQHYGQAGRHADESPYAATVGVLSSTMQLIAQGATHVGVASDHVIESFRNELWAGYKTSEGMAEELLVQIPVMEQALVALGVTTWAMVEYEADDALGAAAVVCDRDSRVERALIVTPDKDLGQCVRGTRIVQYDRRKDEIIDEAGVFSKFGVGPLSIPDYLGLVGDTADGFPGLPGWGAKGTSTVLAKFGHIEDIPADAGDWQLSTLRGADKLAATLRDNLDDALLFRRIATVVTDIDVGMVDDWRWQGPTPEFKAFAVDLGAPQLFDRAERLAARS